MHQQWKLELKKYESLCNIISYSNKDFVKGNFNKFVGLDPSATLESLENVAEFVAKYNSSDLPKGNLILLNSKKISLIFTLQITSNNKQRCGNGSPTYQKKVGA